MFFEQSNARFQALTAVRAIENPVYALGIVCSPCSKHIKVI